ENNITISFDPNIRLKLWTIDDARETFKEIFPHVDILLSGLDELELFLEEDSEDSFTKFANDYNIKDLIIKDGENGSKLYGDGVCKEVDSFYVVVDDTV